MKNAIVKAVVLCTLALSLLFVGVVSVSDVDTNAVAGLFGDYDAPHDHEVVY